MGSEIGRERYRSGRGEMQEQKGEIQERREEMQERRGDTGAKRGDTGAEGGDTGVEGDRYRSRKGESESVADSRWAGNWARIRYESSMGGWRTELLVHICSWCGNLSVKTWLLHHCSLCQHVLLLSDSQPQRYWRRWRERSRI